MDQSAAPPPVVDPRALSESERRAYGNTLRAAHTQIDRQAVRHRDRRARQAHRGASARAAGALHEGPRAVGRRPPRRGGRPFRGLLADFPELPEPRNNLAVLYAQQGQLRARAYRARDRAARGARLRGRAREPRGRLRAPRRRSLRAYRPARQAQPHRAEQAQARARRHRRIPVSRSSRRSDHSSASRCSHFRSRSPRARRQPAGRLRYDGGAHPRRALSRRGAEDRRQLPRIREGEALRRRSSIA